MTARALYRHYDNKQALLAESIRTRQEQYQSARRLTDGQAEPTLRPLSADLPDLIAAAVASRSLTVLWQREARYLNEADRAEVRHRIQAIVAGIRASVLLEVPDLSPPHSELRAWAVSCTLTSLGRHNLTLPADELNDCLYQACMAAATTPPVCELTPLPNVAAAPDGEGVLFSRYETLLAAGADCSARRVTRPSAPARLERGRNRGSRAVPLVPFQASHPGCAGSAPRRVAQSRVHPRATRESASGAASPGTCRRLCTRQSGRSGSGGRVRYRTLARFRRGARRLHQESDRPRERVDRADPRAGPQTTVARARLLVASAISFIEDVARTWHLTRYAGVADEITALAMAILTSAA